jgi:hypothetical protein
MPLHKVGVVKLLSKHSFLLVLAGVTPATPLASVTGKTSFDG